MINYDQFRDKGALASILRMESLGGTGGERMWTVSREEAWAPPACCSLPGMSWEAEYQQVVGPDLPVVWEPIN